MTARVETETAAARSGNLTVESVDVFPVALPTVRSFGVSGGAVTVAGRPTVRVLVKVTAGGVAGWGEATPIPAWTYETAESIVTTIERYLAPAVVGLPVWDRDRVGAAMERVINPGYTIGAPLAKSAVDVALWDLLGRAWGTSVGELLGARRCEDIELAWIISGQSPPEVADSVAEGRELGYGAFKVKVGLHDEGVDAAIVEAVVAAAPGAPVWVDANQGYTVDAALRMARRLAPLGVTVFEQPLPANDLPGLKRLRDVSPLPVALDESLRHPRDLLTFLRLDAVDIAIAKVQRSGGLTLSSRLCGIAADAGLTLMGSGLTDSDLGLAASLHLFSAYGVRGPVDLNGRQFLESPYATSTVDVHNGRARVPAGPGLGVEVDEAVVRELRVDLFA